MDTHTIHKIAISLFLGGTLSVASNPIMAVVAQDPVQISQAPLSLGATGVIPNIMLMLDNSGSMSETFANPVAALVPSGPVPASYTDICTTFVAGGAATEGAATTIIDMKSTSSTSRKFCTNSTCSTTSSYNSTTKCFDPTKFYKVRNYTGSAILGTFSGKNLNWYFRNGKFVTNSLVAVASTVNRSRMEVAKEAGKGLVTSLIPDPGEKAEVRLALSTYNNGNGGKLLVAMGDLKDDKVQANAVTDQIDALSPGGITPLATTLSDIGRYFTLGNTGNLTLHPNDSSPSTDTIANIFNNHTIANSTGLATIVPPIINYCQKSAVILVSDGLPNGDRAISSVLRDYSGDCATKGLCDSTPNSLSLPGADGVPLNGTGTTCKSTKDKFGNIIAPNDWYYKACQNGTKAGRKYETSGSDYVDDVAQALFEMDLHPVWPNVTKVSGATKNNLKTYAIGLADPNLQFDSVLRDAALRGGGSFEYADNVDKLVAALDKIVADIRKGVGSFSAIAANSTQLGANSAVFQAKYDSTDWTGDFLALPLSQSEDKNANGVLDTGEDSNGNGILDTGGVTLAPVWNAATLIPTWNKTNQTSPRNIFTYNSTATPKGVKFKDFTAVSICTNSLTAAQKTSLGISSCASGDEGIWRLDYLRGDISHEQVNELHAAAYNSTTTPTPDPRAGNTNQIFRNRARFYGTDAPSPHKEGELMTPDPWLLGDIVNSDAAYVSNENYGYTKLADAAGGGTTYNTFVNNKNNRRKMLYVGANDGMLHGFDASVTSTDSDTDDGKEILAYMPNTVFSINGGLKNFSSPDYTHRYFVDGTPRVSDVYFDSAWHTVLVGTTGAGGHGVFALDITDPSNFAANHVLWEVSDTDAPGGSAAPDLTTDTAALRGFAKNLGYTLPQPSIAKMNNGSWAAIVANGYASTNGLAVLYIIDIKTGAIIADIDTQVAGNNGLSTPIAIDVTNDGIADVIYAGDLLGNMWKFDVSSSNPAQWKVAQSVGSTPAPLFTACTDASSTANCDASRQAISNKPQVGKVGKTQTTGTVMVYFGTGKYFEETDNNLVGTKTQSFYGIWDECPLFSANPSAVCTTVAKNTLQVQSIIAEQAVVPATIPPTNVRATSNNNVDYPTKKGWYINFEDVNSTTTPKANNGERIVSASLLRFGRIIFVTLIPIPPTVDSSDPCKGGSSSTSWLMQLDAISGGQVTGPAFDINKNGTATDDFITLANGTKVPASGVKATGGSSKTPAVVTTPGGPSKFILGDAGGGNPDTKDVWEPGNSDEGAGRQSWRQLQIQ